MEWIVQHNLYNEDAYEGFIKALEAFDQAYTIVKVIPFVHLLEPDVTPTDGTVIVWGSTTLDWIAKDRGWTPGAYHNENFDQRVWSQIYGSDTLNADAEFHKFGSIPAFTGKRFIRPVHDLKTFAGTIIDGEELARWQTSIDAISDGYSTLTPDTPVSVSPMKEIDSEFRFFVVDGRIVTASLYRLSGSSVLNRVDVDAGDPLCEFAQFIVNRWQPAKAFVIDVAVVWRPDVGDTEYKVIEINTINSSGFYAADPMEIVKALVRLEG